LLSESIKENIVANIRRGLERVGKVLIVWGILVSIIGLYSSSDSSGDGRYRVLKEAADQALGLDYRITPPYGKSKEAINRYYRKEEGHLDITYNTTTIVTYGIIAWAPFLLFKLLFWIGSGFIETEEEENSSG